MITHASIDQIVRAREMIQAARSTTDPEARIVFAARARIALSEVEAAVASLRINIASVEKTLAPPAEAPKQLENKEK